MPTLNYTTKIPVARTIGEIQEMLVRHGAATVSTAYVDQTPSGISFMLRTPHGPRAFSLPVNVDAVRALLIKQNENREMRSDGKRVTAFTTQEHAARVAWRVLKDWVEAQLAIIEAQMATLDQVMLPYLHVDGDLTLYEMYRERESLALNPGSA